MPAPGVNGVAAGFPPSRNPLLLSPAEASFAKAGRRGEQGREKIRGEEMLRGTRKGAVRGTKQVRKKTGRRKVLGGPRMGCGRCGPAPLRFPPSPPRGRPHVQPFLG